MKTNPFEDAPLPNAEKPTVIIPEPPIDPDRGVINIRFIGENDVIIYSVDVPGKWERDGNRMSFICDEQYEKFVLPENYSRGPIIKVTEIKQGHLTGWVRRKDVTPAYVAAGQTVELVTGSPLLTLE